MLHADVTRVVLVGHARIAELVCLPELAAQAFDQLVIPFVMRTRATALNEQDLPLC